VSKKSLFDRAVLTHFRRAGNDPEIFEELRGGEKASSKLSSCQQKRRAPNLPLKSTLRYVWNTAANCFWS